MSPLFRRTAAYAIVLCILAASTLVSASPTTLAHPRSASASGVADGLSPVSSLPAGLHYQTSVGGGTASVFVAGTRAYSAEGAGVTIRDISNPSAPGTIARIPVAGFVNQAVWANNLLYLTSTRGSVVTGRLQIVDITNLAAPILRGTYELPTLVKLAQLVGTRAYLLTDTQLQIVDVADPAAPQLLGSYTFAALPRGAFVVGTRAYVAEGSVGLRILDISNPGQIASLSVTKTNIIVANTVQVLGTRAYVADAGGALVIFDVADPAAPQFLGSYITFGDGLAVQVVSNLAYFSIGIGQLEIVDVSTPANPQKLGSLELPQLAYKLQVVGTVAYLADGAGGLRIANVSDSAHPAELSVATVIGSVSDIQLAQNTAYLATMLGGMQIADLTNQSAPVIRSTVPAGNTPALQLVGTRVYLVDVDQKLRIIDAGNPAAPVARGVASVNNPNDIQVSGTVAYVATFDNSVQRFDVSDPDHPASMPDLGLSGVARSVRVLGKYVYVGGGDGVLQIVDLNGANPQLRGSVTLPGLIEALEVIGNTVYAAYDNGGQANLASGLAIVDVQNPDAPSILGSIDAGDRGTGVQVVGTLAYLATGNTGLLVIDVGDAKHPRLLGSVNVPFAAQVRVVGDTIYVAGAGSGLHILTAHPAFIPAAGTVEPGAGGVVTSHDGAISASFPGGAVASTTLVTLTGLLAPPHPLASNVVPVQSFAVEGRTVAGQALAATNTPFTLSIASTSATQLAGASSADKLQLLAWTGNAWHVVPTTLSGATQRLVAKTSAFTEYVLVAPKIHSVFLPLARR